MNITSVGGKVSVPHLIPYSCAKLPAAAFSEGLSAELRGSGIRVLTVAPGLMRTGSYLNAVFKGAESGDAAWFSASSSLPGISMSAARAARQIVRAVETGRAERILTTPANLLARWHGLFPGFAVELRRRTSCFSRHDRKRPARTIRWWGTRSGWCAGMARIG